MNEKTEKLVAMLAKSGKKLTTAESCTGGMIASEITSVPGASHVFEGGSTTDSERHKEKLLGVAGTVWFAVAAKEGAFARSFRFDGNREAMREQAVEKAIELLTEGTELYL